MSNNVTNVPAAARTKSAFEVRNVGMTYQTKKGPLVALSSINLDVRQGEFLSLIGPSGCGKSTLLEILGGMRVATAGTVEFDGQPVRSPRPDRISFVFQNYSLFPWRSVIRNVEMGLEFRGVSRAQRRGIVRDKLALVGLADFADSYPGELSGGMQQRVALARALACEPEVLLMDEPFGALDEQTRLVMGEELGHLLQATGCTIVFVTHSLSEAVLLSDRIVVMDARPGKINSIYDIDADRPRSGEFMATKEFAQVHQALFEHLRDQIRSDELKGTASA